jgi:phosphate transport system protein
MFEWLKQFAGPESAGLPKMTRDLERMIQEGRHAFDAACSALIGGADPGTVRDDLMATDKRIDELEQSIRRQILVHGSVRGSQHLPELMILMSVAKDAERVGDYAKNLFALTQQHTFGPGTKHHDTLQTLRLETSALLAAAPQLYETQDREAAAAFITRAQKTVDACKEHMNAVFDMDQCTGADAAAALAYRHTRRVAGHIQNVVSGIVNPVDQLDFTDEPKIDDVGK